MTGSSSNDTLLMLDPDIRDWVVLPLFVLMVTAGLLRHAFGQVMQADKEKIPVLAGRAQNLLKQVTKLKTPGALHYSYTTWQWHVRKQHYYQLLQTEADYCEEQHQKQQEQAATTGDDDPLGNMMNPFNMIKGNMAFMVFNMVTMQGIQHFFSGFILLKVPFPLTAGFKSMFQRGTTELPDLDPSYVSSISWYFLVMFGLRSFFRLVIGDPSCEWREQEVIHAQEGLALPAGPSPSAQDGAAMAKALRQEMEHLELFLAGHTHKSELDSVEKRLLGKNRYPKKRLSADDDADFILGTGHTAPKSTSSSSTKKKKSQ